MRSSKLKQQQLQLIKKPSPSTQLKKKQAEATQCECVLIILFYGSRLLYAFLDQLTASHIKCNSYPSDSWLRLCQFLNVVLFLSYASFATGLSISVALFFVIMVTMRFFLHIGMLENQSIFILWKWNDRNKQHFASARWFCPCS